MITTENVTLYDTLNESYGSPYGLGYKGYIFVFETVAERDSWINECTDEDLDYIIENESVETED
ncbi:hypothetical protein pEaSNUABM50_00408 [Erwinia phage pEa_SNUABM_50]|uniref:Uncharacterized protein n=4 Tax=Eneladusvirus BF TaxID=2560751 RepID=A0A7L8ZPC6_9CAUD|nr:hypothetical protein FDH34_gp512 [Serratia phage BF]QOI71347.1 hypothetical protein pEaSNUABM12_00414 [Erwinia phage pEa_SNUABM_12]QOI71889.1 hypothetical protein pEaSNUABM47_00410 [Erwinia phage pEa_SNUABM_47]QOI72428.1 hypothetical protein pEaSNUABM50_00408 [Erwinia phage pEa_SNUABM_50]QXO11555.1 hypothetical protein pEaSNUABM19_00414 [Erwinia phage pEa_SNUABM_19]QXO12103.1 hypothetical protein pEaSNUABM44_00412 [Erwinia phage pEa_SNUABM_44]QXO12656.1 hypothetical protein pEaSNUABM49_004